jgi:hypothetical protein
MLECYYIQKKGRFSNLVLRVKKIQVCDITNMKFSLTPVRSPLFAADGIPVKLLLN